MLFQFPAAIQLGLDTGKLVQVFSKSGVPLGLVRDAVTGRFAGQAVGVIGLNPLTGFSSLPLLQATTAVIGVGVVATAAIVARIRGNGQEGK